MPGRRGQLRRLHLPTHRRALADGAHTFEVRATDGNADPTPARSFTVDTAAPQTTIDSGLGTTTHPTFGFSRGGRLMPVPPFPCPPPPPLEAHTSKSAPGAGNVDATPASRSFTVETVAEPGVTVPETTPPETPPAETVPVLEPEVFPSPRIAPAPVTFSFNGIHRGSTTQLTVSVPGPGTLALFGRKVRKVTKTTATGGDVSVPVRPKQSFLDGGRGPGRTKVYVTYTPRGGAPVTRALWLRLS